MSVLNGSLVKDLMVGAVTIGADASLATAVRLMNAGELDSIVITEGGEAVGILTPRDVIRLVAEDVEPEETQVKEVMSSPLITVNQDEPMETILRLMEEKKVHHIPVIDEGKLVGIITSQRIRSLGLFDVLSIFSISAHAHYTPYLYAKMNKVYETLASKLEGVSEVPEIVKVVSDELRKQELVDEITVEQEGDDIIITVEDCMYSKSVHPFIVGDKELCVMGLLTSMAIQKATGKRVNFVNFCDITERGSITRITSK